jgi:hypothetical protein
MKKLYIILLLAIIGLSTNAQTDEIVYTPFGPALKSKVHFVDSKHHLNIKDGHVQIIDTKTGAVSQEFDNNVRAENKTISNINSKISAADTDNGWITCAYWENNSNKPITYFSTNWIVPSPPIIPLQDSDQIVYLFNGLEPNSESFILQPVLQWGLSTPPPTGGNYWAISNWFVAGYTDYFYDSLIRVSPGTILQGIMKLTSDSGNAYSYNSSFIVDSAGTILQGDTLQVNNIAQLTVAFQTLEVYGITECTEYPADTMVKMTNIQIKMDSIYPTITWNPGDFVTDYGQKTIIISNSSDSGEVDIYFHTPCITTSIVSMSATSDKIFAYPNPAINNLTIESSQEEVVSSSKQSAVIEITNIQGQLIKTITSTGNKTNIDVSALPSGVYVVEVRTGKGVAVSKFIKE